MNDSSSPTADLTADPTGAATTESGWPRAPRPARSRWQPLRSGLLNLYRFDDEEFHYVDGHLLLRGNNGTGKSRILALQLPFLFDGDVSPYRLEPDGDPAKRIEWNLLLGKHADRLGYTWLELGRLKPVGTAGDEKDESSEESFLTLGCGLRAVEGRGLVGKWFFVTKKRVGIDFSLQGSAGEALTRKRLEETLGEHGEVFTSASDYRRAIDRELFGLGEARYEALVRLLIQLRQPQLARKLDEALLSQALSDALPPLSETILADVAEAFASLETDRQSVVDLRAAAKGAEVFLDVYRRYAQVLTRRRAEAVRGRHFEYESSMRRLREAEATSEDAARRAAALGERLTILRDEHQRLTIEVRTLEASPEMRSKSELDLARRRAESAREDLQRADSRLAAARDAQMEAQKRLEKARRNVERRRLEARQGLDAARAAAREAALERRGLVSWTRLEALLEEAGALPSGESRSVSKPALENLATELDQRREGLRLLRRLAEEIAGRELALGHAREELVRITAEVDSCVEAQRQALDKRDAAIDELLASYQEWHSALQVLVAVPASELDEALRDWGRELVGPSPVARAVEAAAEKAREIVASHLAAIESQIAERRAELDDLTSRAKELEEGVEILPPVPHTRDPEVRAARENLAGAPLWKLCDFVDGVPAATRAAAEAALEASGLLDAWVTPEGELLGTDEHDVVLSVTADKDASSLEAPDQAPASSLGLILRPDPAAPGGERGPAGVLAMAENVRAILGRIGWGEAEGRVWVASSGRFRVGPLHGAWAKEEAQYIGASARRAERLRRLAEIARLIEEVEKGLEGLRHEREETRRQAETIRSEVASAATDDGLRAAGAEVSAARREVTRARERQVAAERRVQERRAARDELIAERDSAASDLGLEDRLDQLEDLERSLVAYDRHLAALGPVLDLQSSAAMELVNQQLDSARRDSEVAELALERGAAETRSSRAEAERETLEENLGETVERLLLKLEKARDGLRSRDGEIERSQTEQVDLRVEQAKADERISAETQSLVGHDAARNLAIDGLRALASLRLIALAASIEEPGDPAEWSVTRAVEVARALEVELGEVESDQAVWDRLQGRVHERFRALTDALLPHGYEPSLTMPSDTLVVKIPFQGQSKHVDEFRGALLEETETRERVLAAREREILENHLLNEVSLHLHDRLRAAEELVREINAEIESRPMSTGMKLRFDWRARTDEVEHLDKARRLLLTDHRMRSPEESRAIGRFLQGLIEAQRESEEGGTWNDHLNRALDYRSWHRFAIEQQQDGQWRRLTRRTHGTGSGGEKAIALTVPQFAAAAAHYRTAREEAPRLILLDEAFVGVDGDMRAKCMGLLAAFDLDFVMTSEREWGCYPTLPGLAIYQLATFPGIDAIGVTRWVWNGKERVRAAPSAQLASKRDQPEPSARQQQIFDVEPAVREPS